MPDHTPSPVGILSAGNISSTMAGDLRLTPGAETVAVAARSLGSAQRFAAEHGIGRAYGSYEELAADPEVDVVYVGATHNAHHRVVRMCLEAGKPVLCEKPFTVDAAQAEALVALARQRGLFLMEAMWMWCQPGFLKLMASLRDGLIGDVRHVEASFGRFLPYDRTHRMYDPGTAGGALLDLGPYVVMLAQAVFGAPSEITAVAHLQEGVDFSTVMACRWPGGQTAALSCILEADINRAAVLSGTGGRVELPGPFHRAPYWTVQRTGEGPEVVETPLQGRGYVHMLTEVGRCLREGLLESPLVPLAESLAAMRTYDRVRAHIGLEYPPAAYA